MIQANLEYLSKQISDLYFSNAAIDQLVKGLQSGAEAFAIQDSKKFDDGLTVNYKLQLQRGEDSEYYFLNRYEAQLHRPIFLSHTLIDVVDTAELENKMSRIDWSRKELIPDGADLPVDVQVVLDQLKMIAISPRGNDIRDKLEAKYFLDTPFESLMAHPGIAKDRFRPSYTFPVYSRGKDQAEVTASINAFDAHALLCGRPVNKFFYDRTKKEGSFPWAVLEKDSNGELYLRRDWYYDLNHILNKFLLNELKDPNRKDRMIAALKQGKTYDASFDRDGRLVTVTIAANINGNIRSLSVYDEDMKLIKHDQLPLNPNWVPKQPPFLGAFKQEAPHEHTPNPAIADDRPAVVAMTGGESPVPTDAGAVTLSNGQEHTVTAQTVDTTKGQQATVKNNMTVNRHHIKRNKGFRR